MALRDTACYTLELVPNRDDPEVLTAIEAGPSGSGSGSSSSGGMEARYARVKEKRDKEGYSAVIYDAVTGAKLASTGMGKEKDRKRRLELHGPDEEVVYDWEGMINFGWNFHFEGNKYHWTREVYGKDYICSLDRKPDPAVEICLARSASKLDNARIQILHYNIDRFPESIKDLRGLETLLVTTLISFLDIADLRARSTSSSAAKAVTHPGPLGDIVIPAGATASHLEPPPPTPPERIITPEDFEPENPNEVVVGLHTSMDEHVARAVHLLEDPHVLFIVIRTRSPEAAQRALEVALGVKRVRHRDGMDDLHQYVVEEEDWKTPKPKVEPKNGRKQPEVINLNEPSPAPAHLSRPHGPPSPSSGTPTASANGHGSTTTNGKKEWAPPPNISVYLSTILLPDLTRGKRTPAANPQAAPSAPPDPKATQHSPGTAHGDLSQAQPERTSQSSLSGTSLTRLFTRKKS